MMAHDSPFHRAAASQPISRREFLLQSGGGLGGLALAAMLGEAECSVRAGKFEIWGRVTDLRFACHR